MAVVAQLVMARHGEAFSNVAGIAGGDRSCAGLTPIGRRQAALLAERITAEHRLEPFAAVYTSTRLRARQTCQPVADSIGLTVTVKPSFRDPDYGSAEGRAWPDLMAGIGGALQDNPDARCADDAESWREFAGRTAAAMSRLFHRHENEKIMVIAHGETIEVAFGLICGLPQVRPNDLRFRVGHCGLTRWFRHRNRYGREFWALQSHNDVTHLTRASTAGSSRP
jgi:probable phosphoglycerate mutase